MGIRKSIDSTFYFSPSEITLNSSEAIVIPKDLYVVINGTLYKTTSTVTVSTSTGAGKDYYIYAVVSSNALAFVTSDNSTVPSGYTATNSRKIGGYHCLCTAVGTISGHSLTGKTAGAILPNSIWDLWHRPKSSPEGMVYDPTTDIWVDIYGSSWDGSKLVSVYNGVWADGSSTKKWHGELHEEMLKVVGKRLPWRWEYVSFTQGSPEGTTLKGSADPNTTGGHVDTNSRRIISNIGVEDCCGVLWQWMADLGFAGGSAWTDSVYSSSVDSSKKGQTYGNLYRLLSGGGWYDGGSCGSRCVACDTVSGGVGGGRGSRGVSEPLNSWANLNRFNRV